MNLGHIANPYIPDYLRSNIIVNYVCTGSLDNMKLHETVHRDASIPCPHCSFIAQAFIQKKIFVALSFGWVDHGQDLLS